MKLAGLQNYKKTHSKFVVKFAQGYVTHNINSHS
jgi:hypothetical protein